MAGCWVGVLGVGARMVGAKSRGLVEACQANQWECMAQARSVWFIWLVWSIWLIQLVWFNQIHKTKQTNQLNEIDQTDRTDQMNKTGQRTF